MRDDLDSISTILTRTFGLPPFKREYDYSFGEIANILKRYAIAENARNLRLQYILCMPEFFDAIPQEEWKTKVPNFIRQSEEFAVNKFREWITEQIT
jgi:hypothetical protein